MGIEKLAFGRTGHQSSRVLFGAAALARATEEVAEWTLEILLENGVNHIDAARAYGEAEVRLRPWLREHPGRFFVATKTGRRDMAGAREELEQSLERLGVDHVDLWQLHNLADPIDWDVALSPGGAIEAAVQARQEGLVKYIGVTGHGSQMPRTHLRSLDRFDFDSVLLPFNYLMMRDAHYAEGFTKLLKRCQEKNVAVQTIKSLAQGPWMGREWTRTTWYKPLEDDADIELAASWALGQPGIFLNSTGDVNILPKLLKVAQNPRPRPTDQEMDALVDRVGMIPLFA